MQRANLISGFVFGMLMAGISLGIYLVGGAPEGSSGIFLVFAGLALCMCPPQRQVKGLWWVLLTVLLGCSLLSLLPQSWFALPSWRSQLQNLPIPLSNHISPAPAESLFFFWLLAISGILLLFGLTHPLRHSALLQFATLGVLLCSVYGAMAIYAEKTGWKYAFDGSNTFGFFPNRNHTATFLMTGCLLSLGILGVAGPQRKWVHGIIAAMGMAVCGSALMIYSASRGGVVFLVIGTFLWLLGLGSNRWSKPMLISFAAVFMAGMVLFLVSKGEARNRLLNQFGWTEQSPTSKQTAIDETHQEYREPTVDARILIFQDTARMILDHPFTGVGLGAFRYVYPFYSRDSLTESTSAHPESDWLQMAAETGVPALLCAILGGVILFWQLRTQRQHPFWALRWGVACAALAAILHGLVDVPLHRMALGWWILFLVMAGCQVSISTSIETRKPPVWQWIIFVITGLCATVMGGFLIRAEWFGGPTSPMFAAQKAGDQILTLYKKDQLDEAILLATKAIEESPMANGLYYQKGVLQLNFDDRDTEVDDLFAAQRALSPNWPTVSSLHGSAWINIDTNRTTALWMDAIVRSRKIDQKRGGGQKTTLSLTENLLRQSEKYPPVQRGLYQAAAGNAQMTLLWLNAVPGALAMEEIPKVSKDVDFIGELTPADRKLFLRVWYEKGDRAALWAFAEEHSDWKEAIWPLQIRRLVDAKNFQEAVQATLEHHRLDLTLPNPGDGKKLSIPEDGDSPHHNFDYFWKAGNAITARRIIEEARVKAEKSGLRSPEIWKKSAALAIHEGRWDVAWSHLQRYLQESKLE